MPTDTSKAYWGETWIPGRETCVVLRGTRETLLGFSSLELEMLVVIMQKKNVRDIGSKFQKSLGSLLQHSCINGPQRVVTKRKEV